MSRINILHETQLLNRNITQNCKNTPTIANVYVIEKTYTISCAYAKTIDNELVLIRRVYTHFYPLGRFAVNTAILNCVIGTVKYFSQIRF